MTAESAYQLQKQVHASTPAGVISDLRKSSPAGHKQGDERSNRQREYYEGSQHARAGAGSVGRAGN